MWPSGYVRTPDRYGEFTFFPCMPYAHKYADAVTEYGMLGSLRRFLPDEGLLNATLRGGRSLATKDIEGITTLLVDAEMTMFRGLRTPVIWLQNVLVDLLLGLGFNDAFAIFSEHVRNRYSAEPGFITMNLPRLLDTLDKVGIENPDRLRQHQQDRLPHVRGYRRLSGRARAAAVPGRRHVGARFWRHPAREAIEWVWSLPNIRSIVFGASSAANIRSTKALVDQFAP